MTIQALARAGGNVLKGAFFPAVFVALGKNLPKFTKTATVSGESLRAYGERVFTTANLAYQNVTRFDPAQLPKVIQQIPKHAQSVVHSHSHQILTAAIWGGAATLTNEVLKRTPVKNQKWRVGISILVGAGVATASSQLGFGKAVGPHLFVDTAIKAAVVATPYIVTTMALDTAVGIVGASASVLTKGITATCGVAQSLLRALSFPGTPTFVDAPSAAKAAPTADPKVQAALALYQSAMRTASASFGTTEAEILAELMRLHPGLAEELARAIAAGIIAQRRERASQRRATPAAAAAPATPQRGADAGAGAAPEATPGRDDTGRGASS